MRMLGQLTCVNPDTEFEVEQDASTVEPLYVEDLFISDRIESLICFTEAISQQLYPFATQPITTITMTWSCKFIFLVTRSIKAHNELH